MAAAFSPRVRFAPSRQALTFWPVGNLSHLLHSMSDLIPNASFRITGRSLQRSDLADVLARQLGTVVFDQCAFDGEDLSRLKLRGARFQSCTLEETSFERSDLAGTVWQACKARLANFHLADLTEAQFSESDLNNTSWVRAKLASAVFKAVKLTGAHMMGAPTLGLTLQESLLVAANLRGLSFRNQPSKQLRCCETDCW